MDNIQGLRGKMYMVWDSVIIYEYYKLFFKYLLYEHIGLV